MPATQPEYVDWINQVITRMWPYIDKTVGQIITETVEPALKQAMPSRMRDIHFQQFSLGDTPVRIDRIHSSQSSANCVSLLADMVYDAQPQVRISVLGMHVGMRQLVFKGRLSLSFKPLVPAVPVIAAVHISFADLPQLDFDMTGVAGAADAPYIHMVLQRVILDAIAAQLVLPNVLTIKLGTDNLPELGDFFAMGYTPPRLLRLTVKEANNLKNADDSGLKKFLKHDKSDPYAVVKLGAQSVKTRTIDDNLNPAWNESFELFVYSDAQTIDVSVWDYDAMDSHDFLGSARVTVAELAQRGDVVADIGYGSSVRLLGELYSLQPDASSLAASPSTGSKAVLSVLVDQAFALPITGQRTSVVKITLGQTTCTTKAINLFRQVQVPQNGPEVSFAVEERPEPNPEWEQALEMLVYDLDATLTVEVLADNAPIGAMSVPLEALRADPNLTLRQKWELQGGGGLFMTLHLYGLQPADPAALDVSGDAVVETDSSTELWLAFLIKSAWPFVDKAVEKMMREQILPMVQSQLPVALSCTQFSLGGQQPRVDNFQVTAPFEDAVLLTLDITYEAECDVQFSVCGVTFGLKKLVFKGKMCVLMQPLVPRIPVIGALQVFFVNPPQIDIDFSGLLDVLDWPLISKTFRQVIKSQLQQQLVLPNHLTVRLANDTPMQNIFWQLYHPPRGVMRVTVVEAKSLKNADDSTGIFSYFRPDKSDPYCILTLGDHLYTTQTINNSLDPVWMQTYDFVIFADQQALTVEIYDDDTLTADDYLGTAQISCKELCDQHDVWLPIEQGLGQVHLVAHWLPLTSDPATISAIPPGSTQATAVLSILIDQATNLPTQGLKGARVEVSVGSTTKTTRTLPLSKVVVRAGEQVTQAEPNPDWEEVLLFLISDISTASVQCSVMTDDTVVGRLTCAAADVLANGKVERGSLIVQQQQPLEGNDAASLAVTFMLAALQGA